MVFISGGIDAPLNFMEQELKVTMITINTIDNLFISICLFLKVLKLSLVPLAYGISHRPMKPSSTSLI